MKKTEDARIQDRENSLQLGGLSAEVPGDSNRLLVATSTESAKFERFEALRAKEDAHEPGGI